jgi:membrane protease YdiL (CAAX protease family)
MAVLGFVVLTFAASWTLFATGAALSSGADPGGNPVFLLGVFAPSLVALGLTAWSEGREGTGALLGRIVQAPPGGRWYVFAITYMAAIKLTTALIHRIVMGAWPAFGPQPVYIMALAIVVSTPVQAGEEIGWRGYALPRLAKGVGLPAASIVVGIIWATWHLPLFFIAGTDKTGQSFPVYLLAVTALSVAMAWLYWRTQGSVLMTMLMHASANNTTILVPAAMPGATDVFAVNTTVPGWIGLSLMWACAIYFLVRMRAATLPP